jgi:hypothetical protein
VLVGQHAFNGHGLPVVERKVYSRRHLPRGARDAAEEEAEDAKEEAAAEETEEQGSFNHGKCNSK